MFKQQIYKVIKKQLKQVAGLSLLLLAIGEAEISYAEDSNLAGKYYERAVMEYRSGHVKAAILELRNAIKQNPEYLAAQILLAEAYLKDKNLILTEVALSQADKLGADPALLVMTRAQLYLFQMKYNQLLKEILPTRFSRNIQPDLYIYRGLAYLQLNQLGYALNEYDTAAEMEPGRIEPIIGRANVLLRLGNMQGAMKVAEKVSKMYPDSADSWFVKASINHVQGRLQEAVIQYGRAVEIDSQHLDARIARVGVLMDLGRDDEAETDLVYLRETYPFDAKAAYLHAVVLARKHREQEATLALTSAAEILDSIKPEFLSKHSQSLMLAGLVNYSLKRFDLAIHYLQIYIQQYPQQPGPYKLLASILLDRGENEKVIKLLKPVMSQANNDYRLLFMLGTAYMQNGQHDQANIILEKASKLEVKGVDIRTELGLNRLAMGQEALAIDELESANNNAPGNIKAGIPLTIMYMNQRQPEKAMRVARKMHEQSPENLTLLNLLGTTQFGAGNRKLARQSFEKAITIDPGFITGHINLSKLDVVEKKPGTARQRLTNLINQHPENVALLIELAKIDEIENDFDNATSWLNKAIKLDSKSLSAKQALIELKLKVGRYPEALLLAQNTQEQHHDNMQVLDLLARSFMANNNQSKAIGVLQIMSRKAGFNAKQLYQIAQQQFAVKDYPAAIKSLKNAVLGNENFIPARIALAEAELHYGKVVFARNHAKFLLEHDTNQPFGHRLMGDIAQQEGKKALAVQHYQTAFDKGQNTFLLMKLYTALKKAGDNQLAFQLVERWVAEHEEDALPVQALAEEYLHAGRLKKSQRYYEQLLKRFEKRPDLLNNLAFIYFSLGDNRALSYAQQAQQLAPDLPSANDTLGWILVKKGEPERGLHYLRTAHARSSMDPEIRYHIAEALYQLQRNDEARAELKAAIKTSLEFNGRDDAKRLLEKLDE